MTGQCRIQAHTQESLARTTASTRDSAQLEAHGRQRPGLLPGEPLRLLASAFIPQVNRSNADQQLGVADSGELIGLTKEEMEATLETLENMAGEIGASVIISREIEVRGRFTSLALESVNGMGGTKDMNGAPSSSLTSLSATSTDVTTTDTETSDMDGGDETDDGNPTDSPTTGEPDGDPNEVIVRSAPVPITPSFLRGHGSKRSATSKQRERTLKPQDFLSSPAPFDLDGTAEDGHDADDEDPQFNAFEFGEFKNVVPSSPRIKLDPTRQAKPKSSKQVGKSSKPPKGARAPVDAELKTPEQIAQRMADKRAKRDKRREERRRALLDPVYDHGDLVTQDGGEGGIDYDKIVSQDAEDELDSIEHLESTNTIEDPSFAVSIVTLKRRDTVVQQSGSTPDVGAKDAGNTSPYTGPRLIVEALVVRKAGFGRGFVDLSQFDEELRHLPSFSLS